MGAGTITVTLSTAWPVTVTVHYATSDGTAAAGSDYITATGTLTYAPGSLSKTFGVTILNDVFDPSNETVNLALSGPVSAALGTPYTATLTILNDQKTSVTPALAAQVQVSPTPMIHSTG